MTLTFAVPGREPLELEFLLLDVNGTLTSRGVPVDGVAERLQQLSASVEIRVLSANTFATLDEVAARLGVRASVVASGEDKARIAGELGAGRCAAVGNGANDEAMLRTAVLGIAVLGPEGAASTTVRAADVVCVSILDALDLLLDERALVATLRA